MDVQNDEAICALQSVDCPLFSLGRRSDLDDDIGVLITQSGEGITAVASACGISVLNSCTIEEVVRLA